jgi:hypothetical protein
VNEQAWLYWYDTLTAVQRRALAQYMETQDLRLVPLLWHCFPNYRGQPLPAHIEWLFMLWYKSLARVYQLALNAYFNANDERLLVFVWDNLFGQAWPSVQHTHDLSIKG